LHHLHETNFEFKRFLFICTPRIMTDSAGCDTCIFMEKCDGDCTICTVPNFTIAYDLTWVFLLVSSSMADSAYVSAGKFWATQL